jgi:hypothetical protein
VLGVANVRGQLVVGFGLGKFGTLPFSVLEVRQDICQLGIGDHIIGNR